MEEKEGKLKNVQGLLDSERLDTTSWARCSLSSLSVSLSLSLLLSSPFHHLVSLFLSLTFVSETSQSQCDMVPSWLVVLRTNRRCVVTFKRVICLRLFLIFYVLLNSIIDDMWSDKKLSVIILPKVFWNQQVFFFLKFYIYKHDESDKCCVLLVQ